MTGTDSGDSCHAGSATSGGAVPVDGHVHFHHCFDATRFLESAASNFSEVVVSRAASGIPGVLMLTEGRHERAFERLCSALDSGAVPGWLVRQNAEATSVTVTRSGIDTLILVAGRQVATREGIEVLALNINEDFEERAPLDETLAQVWAAGATAVIPWGFGKWWGRRGRLVRRAVERFRQHRLMLGDNAGRPQSSGDPLLFRLAREHAIPILPGSDPLPFPSETSRAGRYGCVLRGELDGDRPGEGVVQALAAAGSRLEFFGTREGLARFAQLQVRMQWRMRIARGLQ